MPWIAERAEEIGWPRLEHLMHETVSKARQKLCVRPQRVLLLPPDITRMHSGAGRVTEILYDLFTEEGAEVEVIPTLGQHVRHTADENLRMFGAIPQEQHPLARLGRDGCVRVGELPGRFVDQMTDGLSDKAAADFAEPNADGNQVGHHHQRRPCRPARSTGLRQP